MKRKTILRIACTLLFSVGVAWAADTPAPPQLPGEHTTIHTSGGYIRDDDLADYVAKNIPRDPNGNPQCRGVVILSNSCFGGGLLDDFEEEFDTGGSAPGVPWTGGTAAAGHEPAWAPVDAPVAHNNNSFWTGSMIGSMGSTATVSGDIGAANTADPAAPGNPMALGEPEHPQGASGNGGSNLTWGNNSECVVYAGKPDQQADTNDETDMTNALVGQNPSGSVYNSATNGRTTANLANMLDTALGNLNKDKMLVLYFGDHGDTEFDLQEYYNWYLNKIKNSSVPMDPDEGLRVNPPLHDGWRTAMDYMIAADGMDPEPVLEMTPALTPPEGIPTALDPAYWELFFNGVPVPLPGTILPGEMGEVAIPPELILEGENEIALLPIVPGAADKVYLESFQLSSGGVPIFMVPEPASATILLLGCALSVLRRRHR